MEIVAYLLQMAILASGSYHFTIGYRFNCANILISRELHHFTGLNQAWKARWYFRSFKNASGGPKRRRGSKFKQPMLLVITVKLTEFGLWPFILGHETLTGAKAPQILTLSCEFLRKTHGVDYFLMMS